MSVLSYLTHAMIVNWLRGEDITSLTQVNVGVLTEAPNADGSNVIEPNVGGYQRRPISLTAPAIVNNMTYTENDAPILFPTATADWPQVTYMGLFTEDDQLLLYGQLAAPRTIPNGDVLALAEGSIQLRLN